MSLIKPGRMPLRSRRLASIDGATPSAQSALFFRKTLWTAPASSPKNAPPERHDPNGAQIAQLVEQRIENPRVAGSIPALGTT